MWPTTNTCLNTSTSDVLKAFLNLPKTIHLVHGCWCTKKWYCAMNDCDPSNTCKGKTMAFCTKSPTTIKSVKVGERITDIQ